MGEFSLTHILLVLGIVLIFFGPSRLPSLGSSMGKAIRGFKDAMKGGDSADAERPRENVPAREYPTAALDPREVQPLSREVQERLAAAQNQSPYQTREKSRNEADL